MKRARVQAATDVARMTLDTLRDLGLPISDRDKMLAKDMITTAAFTGQGQLTDDKDVCLQQPSEEGQEGTSLLARRQSGCIWMTILAMSF